MSYEMTNNEDYCPTLTQNLKKPDISYNMTGVGVLSQIAELAIYHT